MGDDNLFIIFIDKYEEIIWLEVLNTVIKG